MRENKLADLSMAFAINALELANLVCKVTTLLTTLWRYNVDNGDKTT